MSKKTFESNPGAMEPGKSYRGRGVVTEVKGVKLTESARQWKLEITLKKGEASGEVLEARIEKVRELVKEYKL